MAENDLKRRFELLKLIPVFPGKIEMEEIIIHFSKEPVTESMILEDIEALRKSFGIEKLEEAKWFRVPIGDKDPVLMESDQAAALLMLKSLSDSMFPESIRELLDSQFKWAERNLNLIDNSQKTDWSKRIVYKPEMDFGVQFRSGNEKVSLKTMMDSIAQGKKARVEYSGKWGGSGWNKVTPLGLVLWNSLLFLIVETKENTLKELRLNQIEEFDVLHNEFAAEGGEDKLSQFLETGTENSWFQKSAVKQDKIIPIRFTVSPPTSTDHTDYFFDWLSTAEIQGNLKLSWETTDGKLVFEGEVIRNKSLLDWLISNGDKIQLDTSDQTGQDLRRDLKEHIIKVMKGNEITFDPAEKDLPLRSGSKLVWEGDIP